MVTRKHGLFLWITIVFFLQTCLAQSFSTTEENLEEDVIDESLTTEQVTSTILPLPAKAQRKEENEKSSEDKDVIIDTSPPEYIFRYNDPTSPCILAKLNISFELMYKTSRQNHHSVTVNLPANATVRGDCGVGKDSSLRLSWNTFDFTLRFEKSPAGDAWFVEMIEVHYDTSENKTFGIDVVKAGPEKVYSKRYLSLFLSPAGSCYACKAEKELKLYDKDSDVRGTVYFHYVKLQPFAVLADGDYGKEFLCLEDAGHRRSRDETVPVAVGSTLAVMVLLTVSGYGVYRYFKVKKIEYDTME